MLSQQVAKRRYGKLQLASDAGITYRTLSHVLGGEQDFKVSTLLAVADRLGLEFVLVPKEARAMFPTRIHLQEATDLAHVDADGFGVPNRSGSGGENPPSRIVSKVQARLARARKRHA